MRSRILHATLWAGLLLAGSPLAAAAQTSIPDPVAKGHDELYSRMESATRAGGETGQAARRVMETLAPHFEKEERYALPQLGVLPQLVGEPFGREATGGAGPMTDAERQDLLDRTERLRAELPQMLEEHRVIAEGLETLRRTALREGNEDIARLAEELEVRAQTEEQVLYPAALLVGEHVAGGQAPAEER